MALEYQSNRAGADETWGAPWWKNVSNSACKYVATSASNRSRGRVVIGQIYTSDDEPPCLNYKHRAGFSGG